MIGSLARRTLGVVGATALSMAVFGTGVSSADILVGKTYSDASAQISEWNGEAVIGTVNGDQLETDDCVVTSWQKSRFLDTSGENSRSNEFVLHLNCNNRLASAGHPGNSLLSPAGAKAKKDQQNAANINENPGFCAQSAEYTQWCKGVCERTGLCDIL